MQVCLQELEFTRPTAASGNVLLVNYCIGVCQSLLRMMLLEIDQGIDTNTTKILTVWELEDYEAGKWSLVHNDYLNTMTTFKDCVQLRAFHPTFGNIVYFNVNDHVVLYNMGTGEIKLVGKIACDCDSFVRNTFHLVLPWWPTPIAALS